MPLEQVLIINIFKDKNFYATGSFIEGGYDLHNKGYNVLDEKSLFKGSIE